MFETLLEMTYQNYETDIENLKKFRYVAIENLNVQEADAQMPVTVREIQGTHSHADFEVLNRE